MTTSFPVATQYAPLAARFQPAAANGRSRKLIALGRVIQVGFGSRGTVRMTVAEAREFAVALMEMASHALPSQVLLVKWQPPGAKYHREKRVRAAEVMPWVGAIFRACREAEAGTLFEGVER